MITGNITRALVESLGQAIVTGVYTDKGFPTEAEIAIQYKASRSVTREAIKMLTAKGMLRARPRSGTVCAPREAWNLFDPDILRWHLDRGFSLVLLKEFTEMRLAVEPEAAYLAASRAAAEDLAGIERGLRRMRSAELGEDDGLEADIEFHLAILRATRNPFFVRLQDMVETALRISIRRTNAIKGRLASLSDHEAVFAAISAGEPLTAASRMRVLVADVLALLDVSPKAAE